MGYWQLFIALLTLRPVGHIIGLQYSPRTQIECTVIMGDHTVLYVQRKALDLTLQ